MGGAGFEAACKSTPFARPGSTEASTRLHVSHVLLRLGTLGEQYAVVDLAVVEQDVRIDAVVTRGALADEGGDLGPGRARLHRAPAGDARCIGML